MMKKLSILLTFCCATFALFRAQGLTSSLQEAVTSVPQVTSIKACVNKFINNIDSHLVESLPAEQRDQIEDMQQSLNQHNANKVSMREVVPFNLPKTFDFNGGAEEFARDFTVIDANEDNKTWAYTDRDIPASPANRVYFTYHFTNAMNDYLVTANPAIMDEGNHFISFTYKARSVLYQENFKILYGTSSDPTTMTEIGSVTTEDASNHQFGANFSVPEAG